MTPEQLAKSGTEEAHQTAYFCSLALNAEYYPELCLAFAVPNGGNRDKITGGKLKAQGVKPGVPDICLPVPRGGYHGLWIEMKVGTNTLSADQAWWKKQLEKRGYQHVVCYSWEQAVKDTQDYLGI